MSRAISIFAMLALASSAHADSPKLDLARKAIDEVRFDDAQRLLVGALADGGNSPAAVREIYKLSASTAVVVGQREVGEQNYRRWLALDASASIGPDVAPKLREPFEAAQAYIAAHGRLTAVATRVSTTVIDVAVTDPLAMAASATIVGGSPVALSTERRAQLVPSDGGAVVVAVLDDRGNRLIELSAGPTPVAVVVPAVTAPVAPPIRRDDGEPYDQPSRVWMVFGVPAAVLILTGVGFAAAAVSDRDSIDDGIRASTTTVYTDIDDLRSREIAFTALGATAVGLGVVLAIPAAILFVRSRKGRALVPYVGGDSAGVSVVGRF